MFKVSDLFQWERFITPTIIRIFYGLAVAVAVIVGLSTLVGAVAVFRLDPLGGLVMALVSIASTLMAIIGVRVVAEVVLITFRISDHLGALRARAEM